MATDTEAPQFDKESSIAGLCYEYQMLIDTVTLLRYASMDPLIRNTVLESFGVHARNLHDFLRLHEEGDRRKGDYWASDFYTAFHRTVFEKAVVDKINRWLQHVTTWRYDMENKPGWYVGEMLRSVVEGMEDFLDEDSSDQDLLAPLLVWHRKAEALLSEFPVRSSS